MRHTTAQLGPRHRQRGAALLTAMIIVTLVATLAAAMVWQQWRAVQVEAAERARVQSALILSGALDFARLILREDLKSGKVTALTEPWATPLAESRLSTFLAADNIAADDGPEAFLSGNIADAQARFNVTNLLNQGIVDQPALKVFQNLCTNLGLDGSVAQRIANGLRDATGPVSGSTPTAAAPLLPRSVAQLVWLGVDAAAIKTLTPYIVVLPQATTVNVNTASKEVIAAIADIDPGTAERLVQVRQRTPFKDTLAFTAQLGTRATPVTNIDVRSRFFEVYGRLRLDDHVLTERSLVERVSTNQMKVWSRERIASLEEVGG